MATLARLIALLALVPAVGGASAPTNPNTYRLDPAGSSLKFIAVQQGARFESHFERFTSKVMFDPKAPAGGRIEARIELGSVDTGNPERDAVLLGADWFGVKRWPEAVFVADEIAPAADGGFVASGILRIRDATVPVTLPFRWTPSREGPARLAGTARLERLAFGIGQGEWRDTTYVGNGVEVLVDVRLIPDSVSTVTIMKATP